MTAMKTHHIEVQKLKGASNSSTSGLVTFKLDALVNGIEPSTLLVMTEANARVLMALLKTQLTDMDGRKPKSRHGRHG